MEIIKWIEEWYSSQCDGDWEHDYGIKIDTLDNPGWSVKIDLSYTDFENIFIEKSLTEKSEHDWYSIRITDSTYKGYGDPGKLEFLLKSFKEIIESHT